MAGSVVGHEAKPVNHYWHGVNLKGVVGYAREHKLAWKRLRGIYRE